MKKLLIAFLLISIGLQTAQAHALTKAQQTVAGIIIGGTVCGAVGAIYAYYNNKNKKTVKKDVLITGLSAAAFGSVLAGTAGYWLHSPAQNIRPNNPLPTQTPNNTQPPAQNPPPQSPTQPTHNPIVQYCNHCKNTPLNNNKFTFPQCKHSICNNCAMYRTLPTRSNCPECYLMAINKKPNSQPAQPVQNPEQPPQNPNSLDGAPGNAANTNSAICTVCCDNKSLIKLPSSCTCVEANICKECAITWFIRERKDTCPTCRGQIGRDFKKTLQPPNSRPQARHDNTNNLPLCCLCFEQASAHVQLSCCSIYACTPCMNNSFARQGYVECPQCRHLLRNLRIPSIHSIDSLARDLERIVGAWRNLR